MKNETRSETRKPCVISFGEYRAKRAAPVAPLVAKLLEQRREIDAWVERTVSDVDKLSDSR